MKKITRLLTLFVLLAVSFAVASAAPLPAQQNPAPPEAAQPLTQFAPNTVIPAELTKSLDAKKAKVGDKVEARTSMDMLSEGKIVMPRGTKILGHVTSVKSHSKESPDSMLGMAFDNATMKDGHEIMLPASIQAIGAPLNAFSNDSGAPVDPGGMGAPGAGRSAGGGGGMGASPQRGSEPGATNPLSGLPPISNGGAGTHASGALSASSQGVVGIKDLSLSATSQASVVSSASKNVHLDTGTQLMLHVQ